MIAILVAALIGATCILIAAGVETIIRKIIKFFKERKEK